MNKNPNLTDIYSDVLLTEGKKRGETLKKVQYTKDNVVTKKQDIGNGKDKKLVGDGPTKAKLRHKPMDKKTLTTDSLHSFGSFEALFKSTLLEDQELEGAKQQPTDSTNMDFEVPTSSEEMADEIEDTEDEVTDLVSDLRDVVAKLNDILEKIDAAQGEEEASEEESTEEASEEESTEEAPEEKGVKESVEDHGTPLMNMRSGTGFNTKQKYVVKSTLKPKKAMGQFVKRKADPELKKLTVSHKDLCNTKNQKVKTSNLTPGDLFNK
jgi:hypothetical protein